VSFDKIINERLRDYAQHDELLVLRKENEALAKRLDKLEGHRQKPEKQWYTVKDLASVMGKSEATVRKNFIQKDYIKADWRGKGYKIPADEFRRIEDSVHVNSGCWKLEVS
jgi:hypothetical protein